MAIAESAVTGLLGTLAGLGLGLVTAGWIVGSQLPEVDPDLGGRVTLTQRGAPTPRPGAG